MKIELTKRQARLIRRALNCYMDSKIKEREEYKELDEIDALLWKSLNRGTEK